MGLLFESHDSILIRINLYLGFKDSMKLIDDKDIQNKRSAKYALKKGLPYLTATYTYHHIIIIHL